MREPPLGRGTGGPSAGSGLTHARKAKKTVTVSGGDFF